MTTAGQAHGQPQPNPAPENTPRENNLREEYLARLAERYPEAAAHIQKGSYPLDLQAAGRVDAADIRQLNGVAMALRHTLEMDRGSIRPTDWADPAERGAERGGETAEHAETTLQRNTASLAGDIARAITAELETQAREMAETSRRPGIQQAVWAEAIPPAADSALRGVTRLRERMESGLRDGQMMSQAEKTITEMRSIHQDLELLRSGEPDPNHFAKNLLEMDDILAEEIHISIGRMNTHGHPRSWTGQGAEAERNARLIFDAFQGSVNGLSEQSRREAARTLADAMLCPLLTEAAAFRDKDVTKLLAHGAPRTEVERGLARNDQETFGRALNNAREASGRLQKIIRDIAGRHSRPWPP